MMIGNVPIMAQDTGENGISEEGKAYLESEEYQKRIKEKEEWIMHTDDGKIGTWVNDVQRVIASYTGLYYEVSDVAYGNFYNNVKTDFDADFPVIYDVDVSKLDSSYSSPTGHYLVGAGYSSSGQLYYSDPGRTSNYEKTVSQSSMISALEGNGGYYIY